jgi:predicted outer membrane repeat protein
MALCSHASIIYVDSSASGTSNGLSWTNAYTDLQPAINAASAGDTLWVAGGTYFPTQQASNTSSTRDTVFFWNKDLEIYGGFLGTETSLGQRNSVSNLTILSGDIGTKGATTDNSIHTLITAGLSSSALLDGFIIQDGYANSSTIFYASTSFNGSYGGGIYNSNSSPFINNCTIKNNSSYRGGGIYFQTSSSKLVNCIVSANTSTYQGGGVYSTSSPVNYKYCSFLNNTATNSGGGVYNTSSSSDFDGCSFTNNSAGYFGGGMYSSSSTISVDSTLFTYNSAQSGGGISNLGNPSQVTNSYFISNTATSNGGGMYNQSASTVSNCVLTGNKAANGGGMYNYGYVLTISNCIFSLDTATSYGGAIYNYSSNSKITNTTFATNEANTNGGAIFSYSYPTLTNNIFWDNTRGGNNALAGSDIANTGSTSNVTYCITQSNSSYSTGTGILNNQNPLFVNASDPDGVDNTWSTMDDGLALQDTSPAIDVGLNAAIPAADTTDLIGNIRKQGGYVDYGAYEAYNNCNTLSKLYVDISANGTGDGSSWANAFVNLQDAMLCGDVGDTLWVATGTYYPTRQPVATSSTRDTVFFWDRDLKIFGGFVGTETLLSQRNVSANPTILSGDIGSKGVSTDNSLHTLITSGLSSSAVLDGFTIQDGNANGSSMTFASVSFTGSSGGGLYNHTSSPIIVNCTVSNNSASNVGGGMFNYNSTVVVDSCTFMGNTAVYGGGLYNNINSPKISNSYFVSNSASQRGGGIYNFATATIINCVISKNKAGLGGGIFNDNNVVTISNSIFTLDSATSNGGAIYNFSSNSKITNSTFTVNEATTVGGAIFSNGTSTITNNIFWDNTRSGNNAISGSDISYSSSSPNVTYCITQSNSLFSSGTGIINNQNPIFVNASDPDGADDTWFTMDDGLALQDTSPAIDLGSNTAVPSSDTADIIGAVRIKGGVVDAGAYESENLCNTISRLYVDKDASGSADGTTWSNAMTQLQDAISCADVGDTLWVAEGTYLPNRKPNNSYNGRDSCFYLNKDIKIFGGFDGTETDLSQRNISVNPTVLSGNVGSSSISTDNSYHVMITADLTSAAVIDGFTFQDGNSNGNTTITYSSQSYSGYYGAGMNNYSSSPTLANCTFKDNSGYYGAGMYNYDTSSPSLESCTFIENTASYDGGAIYNHQSSSPEISGTSFTDNTAQYGAGIYNYISCSPSLDSCAFSGNTASYNGGAIYNLQSSSPEISRTSFADNAAQNGAGIYNYNSCSPSLDTCTFSGNTASYNGGAIYNLQSSSPEISRTSFADNAAQNGAGIYNYNSCSPSLDTCTFSGNTASYNGGAIYNFQSSSPIILRSNMIGNTAYRGAGMYNESFSNPEVKYCYFKDNSSSNWGGGIFHTSSGSFHVTDCIFSGNSAGAGGGGIYSSSAAVRVVSCAFDSNTCVTYGGALYLGGPSATSINCTFSENESGSQGGAIYPVATTDTITNCIFWNNKRSGSATVTNAGIGATSIVSYCLTQQNSLYATGTSIINNQNPLFIDSSDLDGADNILFTADDGLSLQGATPVLDAGLNSNSITEDITGANRVQGASVDIGAYEVFSECKLTSDIPTASATYTSTFSDSDGNYTCYCDADRNLLLALDTNNTGAVIPENGVSIEIGGPSATTWTTAGGIVINPNGGAIMNRKWEVAPTVQPTSNVKVKFFFTKVEYDSVSVALSRLSTTVTNPSDLQMYKLTSAGTFGDPHASGATGAVLLNGTSPSTNEWLYSSHPNTVDHVAEYLVSSFSGGGGGGGANGLPVPVELTYFKVEKQSANRALLEWQTASELNNDKFEIERQISGTLKFEKVGEVAGAVNSQQLQDYSFVDDISELSGRICYRIKQVDYDGRFENSEIRCISKLTDNLVLVYPNPVKGLLNIELTGEQNEYTIQILSINGVVVKDLKTVSSTQINLSDLGAGVYFVQGQTKGGKAFVQKLIVYH